MLSVFLEANLLLFFFTLYNEAPYIIYIYHYKLAEDGESDEQVVLVSQSGTANRIKVRDVSIQSRYARYECCKVYCITKYICFENLSAFTERGNYFINDV